MDASNLTFVDGYRPFVRLHLDPFLGIRSDDADYQVPFRFNGTIDKLTVKLMKE